MPNVDSFKPGQFCWTDLATTDAAGAKAFYTSLFGWEPFDVPAGPDMTYSMLRMRGRDVAALSTMQEAMRKQGVPPHWNVYVAVASADASAAKAKELGATIVAPPFDVFDAGRMAVLADPTGATLSLWEGKRHAGAGITGEPGALTWCELLTTDVEKAMKFYEPLFGWSFKVSPEYTEIVNDGKHQGGMMKIKPEMGPMPPSWGVYFHVSEIDAMVGKLKAQGGKVYMPAQTIAGAGRFAVVADPQGAAFSFYEETKK